ncbi:hypothetical protein QUB56_32440 [Microcoleus sp. AR_TQ3_B6]
MNEWTDRQRCFCQSTNAVPAVAHSAPPTRLQTNRRTGINSSNRTFNTPPIAPIPIVNQRNENQITGINSSNRSSNTIPINSSTSTGDRVSTNNVNSGCLIGVGAIMLILSAIAFPSFINLANKAKQSEAKQYLQLQLNPKQVITRYYQLAPSNRTEAKALLSDALKTVFRQQNPNSDGKSDFWDSINRVETYSFKTETQSSSNHQIEVWLKFLKKDGEIICESKRVEVIFDSSKSQWLINKVSDVDYNIDCGG